jgi:hypothetical protein
MLTARSPLVVRALFLGFTLTAVIVGGIRSGRAFARGSTASQPTNTVLLERLYHAAYNYIGTSTDGLPGQGFNSCAAAVQVIVRAATARTIGTAGVDDWRNLATSPNSPYGGTVLAPGQQGRAHRGAIIIWPQKVAGAGHIGFCATDGCSVTWSNHSDHGLGSVCPRSGSFFAACGPSKSQVIRGGLGMYAPPNNTFLIWEPAHIP